MATAFSDFLKGLVNDGDVRPVGARDDVFSSLGRNSLPYGRGSV
jgi:hypothetical protein